MAINYNAGTNTITVTGYTEIAPCTFLDIYNDDVAGGWGVVTKQGANQFYLQCRLSIGDGSISTWFADSLKQIVMDAGSNTKLHIRANSNFQLGITDVNNNSYGGCFLMILNPPGGSTTPFGYTGGVTGNVRAYDSTLNIDGFWRIYNGTGQVVDIRNCTIQKWKGGRFSGTTSVIKNVRIHDAAGATCWGVTTKGVLAEISNVSVYRSKYGVYYAASLSGAGTVISNFTSENNDYAVKIAGSAVSHDLVLKDSECDTWNFYWDGSAANSYVYRKYSFDLNVQDKDENDINGATVKIWDKNNNLVVDTITVSGTIATQILTYGHYRRLMVNTPTMETPHLIKIEKAGYTTYEADFTLDEKIDWRIALQAASGGAASKIFRGVF